LTRVKICGITQDEDLVAALDAGADALGFVVGVPSSPRNLPLERAAELVRLVPVFSRAASARLWKRGRRSDRTPSRSTVMACRA
jgi:phosphoribosylanthranilate isomerase